MKRFFELIADHPYFTIGVILLITLVFLAFIKSLRWIPPSLLGGGKRRFAEGE